MENKVSPRECKIAVIGAGIVGLSTALQIQNVMPNAKITLFAERFLKNTTSHGAAGIFRPGLNFSGPNSEITKKWLSDSYNFYVNFLRSQKSVAQAEAVGAIRRKTFIVSSKSLDAVKNFLLEPLLDDFRLIPEDELKEMFHNDKYKFASSFTTLVIECRKFLPFLMKKFEEQRGVVICRKINSFEELSDDFDIIFNCSGLGAKELCGDVKMTPIRGQVFKVKAPWVQDAFYLDSDTYIIPGTDGLVTLGGTRQFDSTNEEVDLNDSAGIWERCTSFLPSLQKATVLEQWVGLRPYRPEVRVEKEEIQLQSGKFARIVHNYGHGGYGVMTSPGTAMYAARLGLELLMEMQTSKL